MNDKHIKVYLNCDLKNADELLYFIAAKTPAIAPDDLVDSLLERETGGSLFIAEQVILPHLESELLTKSQVYFITLKQPFLWRSAAPVKMAIVILLKTAEQSQLKREIAQLAKSFADEAYLQDLMNENEVTTFYQKLKQQEES
jgi:PTS system fructose-specific IIA component